MRRTAAAPLSILLACGGDPPLGENDTDASASPQMGESEWELPRPKRIDIVFVVDDSASMGDEQSSLAHNWPEMVNVIEDLDDGLTDYRIAVVRTSGGGCDAPAGQTVTSSCQSRLDDFVIPPGREALPMDLAQSCLDACAHATVETLPTVTVRDSTARPRPWLQNVDINERRDNVTVDMGEALACWGMVGVGGCDYESPFEALSRFLDSTEDPESPNYDFLRNDAVLYALFIGDEDDCSLREPSILDPEGDRIFWPADAEPDRAPSATCFRAGVSCEDLEGDAWSCSAADRRADGSLTPNPSESVLTSVSEMRAQLASLDALRLAQHYYSDQGQTIFLGAIGGVNGVGLSSTTMNWPKSGGPEGYVGEFGVGPSCERESDPAFSTFEQITAAAPARIVELVESFTEDGSFSSCVDDFTIALEHVAEPLVGTLRPFCFERCPKLDPTPACTITLEDRYEDIPVPECVRDEDGYVIDNGTNQYLPPEGSELCVAYMTDASDATNSPLDDLSQECSDSSFPLEFRIARTVSSRIYEGRYLARCELADPATCPAG